MKESMGQEKQWKTQKIVSYAHKHNKMITIENSIAELNKL